MNLLQQQASNPNYSVWVSASAGTGKTKILTDRVLRLLIGGVEFSKILCLTFTNVAAGEMRSRIAKILASWTDIPQESLQKLLTVLLGREASKDELFRAKTLYYRLIDCEEVNIYTIHSFCQKLLKKLPLEAGINPGAEIIDEIKFKEIIGHIKQQLYNDANNADILNFFAANFHEVTLNDIYEEILNHKLKFRQLDGDYLGKFAIPNEEYHITAITTKLAKIKHIIGVESISDLKGLLLTKDGSRRKNILPKNLRERQPELLSVMEGLQEDVYRLDQAGKISGMFSYSENLVKLAKSFLALYEEHKKNHSLLDYDDLINISRDLLMNEVARPLVLEKLEGGIDHLLVDEAQDTSPQQWQIVAAIIQDFYREINNKSIFVVGDEKQSIFSFQGADLSSFARMNNFLKEKLTEASKEFKVISLEYSYRSTAQVLDVVYNIFERIKKINPDLFAADNPKIIAFREGQPGKVELWPIISVQSRKLPLFWPLPHEHEDSNTAKTILAVKIAEFIKDMIERRVILPSTKAPATAGDFMILVRRRDEFTREVIKQLKEHKVEVAGIDRITISDNLSVADLLSAAKFVLNPHDDLNLACLLKSPIIGMPEEDLQLLAMSRGDRSLWGVFLTPETLNRVQGKSFAQAESVLNMLLNIYQNLNSGNFFHIIIDSLNVRELLVTADGMDSNDAINELIYLSYNYFSNIDYSLQSFIYWFEENRVEVKRTVDKSDLVRVMTSHSSKGLQAPVVILCDTTSLPVDTGKFIWTDEEQLFAVTSSNKAPDFFKNLKRQQHHKDLREYLRLLYVAMTRAEDHLVVCGHSNGDKLPENCWYELIAKSMQDIAAVQEDGRLVYGGEDKIHSEPVSGSCQTEGRHPELDSGSHEMLNQVQHDGFLPPEIPKQVGNNTLPHPFLGSRNGFGITPVKFNNGVGSPIRANSPLAANDYLDYATVFHKVLEDALKYKSPERADQHYLLKTLPDNLRHKLLANLARLKNNPEFCRILQKETILEVNIGTEQKYGMKTGRIDLLVIEADKITVIDYKTDARPPVDNKDVPLSYREQLNFYRYTMEKLYQGKTVECKILWLENGSFMEV